VLGDKKYAATRINLAQSMNGIGWIFGPMVGGMFFYSKNAAGESTGSETLYIPYLGVALVVLVLSVIFYFANMPDIKAEDDYHLDDANPNVSHSIWSHPHFVMAVVAQFFYVAAQSGIFSFFINYMTSQMPPIPDSLASLVGNTETWFETSAAGVRSLSDQGAATLASVGFIFFLLGRFTGAGILKKVPAHKVLGLYGLLNIVMCALIFLKLGWISVICVFLSYFFMSIMFPTIFALGIFGLGVRAKKASSYIVMAIMGGALLPKLMGRVADEYDMSRGFIVPLLCFVVVALYGFMWPKLAQAESMGAVDVTKGH
jgi:FHS family L-fucose permease-like MFS transporter